MNVDQNASTDFLDFSFRYMCLADQEGFSKAMGLLFSLFFDIHSLFKYLWCASLVLCAQT